jgi:hypothetical protein
MTQSSVNGRQAALPDKSMAIALPMRTSNVIGAGSVDPDDLSRFEGEGGLEAPNPDPVDAPRPTTPFGGNRVGRHIK